MIEHAFLSQKVELADIVEVECQQEPRLRELHVVSPSLGEATTSSKNRRITNG
jgi:hypothetical protein